MGRINYRPDDIEPESLREDPLILVVDEDGKQTRPRNTVDEPVRRIATCDLTPDDAVSTRVPPVRFTLRRIT